jgi:hypothetical protein
MTILGALPIEFAASSVKKLNSSQSTDCEILINAGQP